MARLSIPPVFDKPIRLLNSLTSEKVEELIDLAGEVSEDFSSETAISKIAEKSEINESDLQGLFQLFINLIGIKELNNYETQEFIGEITEALEEKDIKPTDSFEKNLLTILAERESSFYLKTKSLLLASENPNTLLDAKIISDIRPVFGEDIDETFLGSVILHKLKLVFKRDQENKELYLTLDSSDLSKIKEQIKRAEKKEKAIRKKLESSSIRLFNINE